jgi:hypothetical protein
VVPETFVEGKVPACKVFTDGPDDDFLETTGRFVEKPVPVVTPFLLSWYQTSPWSI